MEASDLNTFISSINSKPQISRRYTLSVKRISPEQSNLTIKLCTGTEVDVPTSLLEEVTYLGEVQDQDQKSLLATCTIDPLAPTGQLISQLVLEIERLTGTINLLKSSRRRYLSSRETEVDNTTQHEVKQSQKLELNLPTVKSDSEVEVSYQFAPGKIVRGIQIICSGYACGSFYSAYTAPRPVTQVVAISQYGCQVVNYSISGNTVLIYHTGVPGMVCGDAYSGKVSIDVLVG